MMKIISTLFLGSLFIGASYVTGVTNEVSKMFHTEKNAVAATPQVLNKPYTGNGVTSVDDIVTKALAFKASLTTSQQSTLQQTYTTTLARKWSNLPCGSGCRNGIQFGTLTSTQLGLALQVIQAAYGVTANECYDEFYQIHLADKVLQTQYSGGTGYDSTIYFIAYLNAPSTSSGWMLQFGGHHFAANIAFNGGKVVGVTPSFRGVEPTSFTVNTTTYAPLNQELTGFRNMLASFTGATCHRQKLKYL